MKAGASLIRSPLTEVMVCPGGFCRAPGAGPDSAAGAAGGDAAAEGNDGDLNGRVTVETGWRGAATARGAGAVATRLGRGAVTTTSGTGTEGGAGAAGALGSAGAGAGVGWLMSGFGVSVDPAGADESCVRPGTARTAALMRARTKGNIGQ